VRPRGPGNEDDSSLKRIIPFSYPEPSFPSQGSQARGTRLYDNVNPPQTPQICARKIETKYKMEILY
jgi:hypothetical protein